MIKRCKLCGMEFEGVGRALLCSNECRKIYKTHIESHFDENMNWGNHGTYWEIDHIIPLNTFDLTKVDEQIKAFNYNNTRPLEKNEHKRRPKDGSDIVNNLPGVV